MTNKTVTHVIVNNLGGITSLVQNLILYKGNTAVNQELILLDIEGNLNTPAILNDKIPANVTNFSIQPKDNWYHTYKRLANLLRKSEGLLVTNDQYDLIMLQAFNIPQKVIQLVHDEYNLQLTIKFSDCIDVFLAHSLFIYELLQKNMPLRSKDIIHIPYGVPLVKKVVRNIKSGPLKLIFLGRHDKAKGVYDLHRIDKLLKEKEVVVSWLILGSGQETETLKKDWSTNTNVEFSTPETYAQLISLIEQCDIFVFPTKFEGFPVSLLETMSTGCIPIVTDLPGGIQEIVKDGITGFKCPIDDNDKFAEKISFLDSNRESLLEFQKNAMNIVHENYNASIQFNKYQQAFNDIINNDSLPKHHFVTKKIGSRLDQPWIPNLITKAVRKLV